MLKNVTKRYQKKFAVNSFDLRIHADEIVCLLGNNGSGKTTLINMLVGLTKMTAGDAKVYGYKVSENIEEIRNNTRLCP